MKIWTDISSFKATNPVLTIGSFDGVHLGHCEVIRQLNALAKASKGESVVFTFDPHPAMVLNPDIKLDLLTTIEEKTVLLEKAGIDHLILFPFTKEFSSLNYKEFVVDILLKQLNIHSLLLGHDNTIGKNREGNYEQILALSEQHGFNVFTHKELKIEEGSLSSTMIRKMLHQGQLFDASKLLGYPYSLSGEVVHGKKLGNKLGFPTANILPSKHKFIPAIGVYAVRVIHENKEYSGMMNIGIRPTINDEVADPVIEVNLFRFESNLYGQQIRISVLRKIREEAKFESLDALKHQLHKDKVIAIEILDKEFGIQ